MVGTVRVERPSPTNRVTVPGGAFGSMLLRSLLVTDRRSPAVARGRVRARLCRGGAGPRRRAGRGDRAVAAVRRRRGASPSSSLSTPAAGRGPGRPANGRTRRGGRDRAPAETPAGPALARSG